MTVRDEVSVAGVPWPVYKLLSLAVGLLAFVIVGLITVTSAPAVLAAAGACTVVWLGLGAVCSDHSGR